MRRSEAAILLVILGALGGFPAFAQTEYTMGVGDVLDIRVWQREDLSGQVVVDSEGNVSLPLVGAMHAEGQTTGRLADELARRFTMVDPSVSQVSVTVVEYNSRRVYVMGEVLHPGAYAFPRIPGVWDVIREAGGPTVTAALSRVRVVPPEGGGVPRVVDLEEFLATGDRSRLPALVAGSTILVPSLELFGPEKEVVYVYGQVRQPGTFSIDMARTVLEAVLAAGGPLNGADMGHVRVIRPGSMQARVFDVDLEDYTRDGELFANVPLRPGDTVTIPRSGGRAVFDFARGVVSVSRDVLATIFFFVRLGDRNY